VTNVKKFNKTFYQEKYRKSSMSDKIKSKFAKPGRLSAGKLPAADSPGSLEGMSKFLSYSHGALADLVSML
jgi:hypothetical protein